MQTIWHSKIPASPIITYIIYDSRNYQVLMICDLATKLCYLATISIIVSIKKRIFAEERLHLGN